MSIYVNNTFRVKRSAQHQEMMKKLIDANIFKQYKDILMISAVIGFARGRYVPIEKAATDGVLMQFFQERDYDMMDLIAYAHKKEQSIIKSDEKYDIFANYANGGFPILLEQLDVEKEAEISEEEAINIAIRYYSMLLSDGFMDENVESELFI